MSSAQQRSGASELRAGQTLAFVCGLHRTGTSPLAKWIAENPKASRLTDTGVPEDEGQHLQQVLTRSGDHGGAGLFAFDPNAHLTEASTLASKATRRELLEAWTPYWDLTKEVLLEKSPPNFLRTRLLQAVFPEARFVGVIRHPVAVAYATRRINHKITLRRLLEHWWRATEVFLEDAKSLEHVTIVRYEDVVANPEVQLDRVFEFLGLPSFAHQWPVDAKHNQRYMARWSPHTLNLAKRGYLRYLEHRFADRFAEFGYSLRSPDELTLPRSPQVRSLLAVNSSA